MIELKAMTAAEFPDYQAFFIADYADEISRNYDVDFKAAHARAVSEVNQQLGQGVKTQGQLLFCILNNEAGQGTQLVGYIWCSLQTDNRTVFISDFAVLPQYRGCGIASAALNALETWLGRDGYDEFRLRVAADNEVARKVYLKNGFKVTGINMKKSLTKN